MSKRASAPSLVDRRLVKALADPVRAHALNVCNQRPSSPSEIAKELGVQVALVCYHLKELEKINAVEKIAGRKKGGGGPATSLYKANIRQFFDADAWALVPPDRRLGVTLSILALVSGDLVDAVNGQTLDERDDRHVSRMPMTLDEEGWKEVVAVLEQVLEELIAIQARATGRMATSGEATILAKAALLFFPSPSMTDA